MLVIRLFRVGKKKQAHFKIVVTDSRRPPHGGRSVEQVGTVNPITKEKTIKKERIEYWLGKGAKPSSTVYNLLISEKIIEGKKIPKHSKPKKEEERPKEEAKKETGPAAEKPVEKKKENVEAPAEKPAEKPAEQTS